MTITAWLFGIGGILANFLIYQQKKRKHLLTVKLIADCVWTTHYALLGAWSGSAVCSVGIIRESVFLNENKKWASGKRWLVVFLLLSIASAVFTWKNIFSLFPSLAAALTVFSFWRGDPRLAKILAFPISFCFLTYNISCHSYVGIINEAVVLTSALIGLIRDGFFRKSHC